MKQIFSFLLISIFITGFSQPRQSKKMRILFIFDASNSMKGMINGKTKMDHAKQMFVRFVDSLSKKKNYEFALRMYGHTVSYPPGDCNDSKLVVPFQKNNVTLIKQKVQAAKPTGTTPIEKSLSKSATDFPDQTAENIIILITDGIEECGGDPCMAKTELEKKGILIRPYIIGVGLSKQEAEAFNCVGTYVNGDNPAEWDRLNPVIEQLAVNRTTSQINLLDQSGRPTETNVNVTVFDQKSGNMLFNYVHSMNEKGNPDTISTLPSGRTYRLVSNTIPQVEKKNVNINFGKHNIIPIDCPQGNLFLHFSEQKNFAKRPSWRMCSIVRKSSGNSTLHVQNFQTREKYITGSYDLEVLTLPITLLRNVRINQSLEKDVEVALPGYVSIFLREPGDGSIFLEEEGQLKRIVNLDKNKTQQFYLLQPGKYRISYRARSQKMTIFTIDRSFEVESEKEYQLDLITQ